MFPPLDLAKDQKSDPVLWVLTDFVTIDHSETSRLGPVKLVCGACLFTLQRETMCLAPNVKWLKTPDDLSSCCLKKMKINIRDDSKDPNDSKPQFSEENTTLLMSELLIWKILLTMIINVSYVCWDFFHQVFFIIIIITFKYSLRNRGQVFL